MRERGLSSATLTQTGLNFSSDYDPAVHPLQSSTSSILLQHMIRMLPFQLLETCWFCRIQYEWSHNPTELKWKIENQILCSWCVYMHSCCFPICESQWESSSSKLLLGSEVRGSPLSILCSARWGRSCVWKLTFLFLLLLSSSHHFTAALSCFPLTDLHLSFSPSWLRTLAAPCLSSSPLAGSVHLSLGRPPASNHLALLVCFITSWWYLLAARLSPLLLLPRSSSFPSMLWYNLCLNPLLPSTHFCIFSLLSSRLRDCSQLSPPCFCLSFVPAASFHTPLPHASFFLKPFSVTSPSSGVCFLSSSSPLTLLSPRLSSHHFSSPRRCFSPLLFPPLPPETPRLLVRRRFTE